MLDLLDYRRQISALYAAVRDGGSCENTHQLWRDARDELFSRHPQSALGTEQKKAFAGLNYFPYDSAYDVLGEFQATASGKSLTVMLGGDGETRLLPIGRVRFALPAGVAALTAYWIEGYGGGLFIPFGDASNGCARHMEAGAISTTASKAPILASQRRQTRHELQLRLLPLLRL